MAYQESASGVVYEDFIKLVAKMSAHFNRRQEADGTQAEADQATLVRKQIYFEVKRLVDQDQELKAVMFESYPNLLDELIPQMTLTQTSETNVFN